ncbi:Gfo/Idh/MocA family protein [Rhizobium rhizogenes]|uniref:Gfo/Idh/MocA family protein n=1 Tax=Rhizobium rhizogenes TaxID=359 RepID=UPI0015743F66|nr:Gfo/Idh/MocA family oxidoreductase [Rhizobium rhizogenes]NTF85384.1 Gfo/Idh/MocA family oxidoreductase [Rhizobium rhizogenes]NTI31339.1 Gfo/Idh/MocA family oxidoreductase [Rhizobium rhizogenes]
MRLGFVGFGPQAQENLIPCCQLIPGTKIVAVCDLKAERRALAQQLYGIEHVFADYREMMARCDLDAVIAACYPGDHFEIATYSLQRGVPIFVEKPPAPSSAHLLRLIQLAERSQGTTGVGMNFRFATVTNRVKAFVRGDIESITLRHFANKPIQPFWNYTSLTRSFLHAQTIHSIDFLIDLCGPVRHVSVFGHPNDSRLALTIVLTFESGAHASLITGNTTPHFVFDFDVICTGGRHIASSALWNMGIADVGKVYDNQETKRWADVWMPSPLESGFARAGYAGQMAEFLAAVKEQRDSAISFSSLAETYRCLDEIEARLSNQVFLPRAEGQMMRKEAL